MDENQTELLRLIYTRIGMVMENASVVALDLGGPSRGFDDELASELRRSVDAVAALMAAAQALCE